MRDGRHQVAVSRSEKRTGLDPFGSHASCGSSRQLSSKQLTKFPKHEGGIQGKAFGPSPFLSKQNSYRTSRIIITACARKGEVIKSASNFTQLRQRMHKHRVEPDPFITFRTRS